MQRYESQRRYKPKPGSAHGSFRDSPQRHRRSLPQYAGHGDFQQSDDGIVDRCATFTLTGPGASPVAGQVTYDASSKTAIFTPSATLALNTVYTGTVSTGAKDMSGDGLASNQSFSFTTGSAVCQPGPPSVISVGPPDGTVGVCNNTVAVAGFSVAMNPSTINTTTFTLAGSGAAAVAGQVTYDAPSRVAIFTPSSALAQSTLTQPLFLPEPRMFSATRWRVTLPGALQLRPQYVRRRWCLYPQQQPLKSWLAPPSQIPVQP